MRAVAFVGISGVGKSTFLRAASERTIFLHLEASKLIKDELRLSDDHAITSEELRTSSILDNQTLLLRAYHRHTRDLEGLVVLDGHTVVDIDTGFLKIPASVFSDMGICEMFFLQDHPELIKNRRASDKNRIRPERTVQQIADQQVEALITTANISLELSIPMHVVTHKSASDAFVKLKGEREAKDKFC